MLRLPRTCWIAATAVVAGGVNAAAAATAATVAAAVTTTTTKSSGSSSNLEFFVDPILGNDQSDGTSPSAPFRTLHRAADAAAVAAVSSGNDRSSSTRRRRRRRTVVHLLPGEYRLDRTLVLDERHGNSTWKKAERGSGVGFDSRGGDGSDGDDEKEEEGRVRVRGGFRVPPSLFRPWKDDGDILVAPIDAAAGDLGDLRSGALQDCANSKAELFFDGEPQILARYPNIDYSGSDSSRRRRRRSGGAWRWDTIRNVTGDASFAFGGTRPIDRNYSDATDLWLHGYWKYDWADNFVKVRSVDAATRTYEIDTNASRVLYSLTAGARYYAVNLLQELDAPGEYYIDRRRRLLYVIPPSPIGPDSEIILSTIDNLITARDVSNLVFERIDFSISRGTALNFTNVTGVGIIRGSVTNVGGSEAIQLLDATDSRIVGVTVNRCACGGVSVRGGDRHTLTPSGISVRRNRIGNYARWKRTYMPGVKFDGCGHVVSGNEIFAAPHEGISGAGNDCFFSDNRLHDLCYEGVDAGAFYAGRSWAERGNVVRNNLFERIRATENATLGYSHVQAIYLDDQMAGYSVINNTVVDSDTGILLGGGRDNELIGNRFIRTDLPLSFDDRGLNWDTENCKAGGSFQAELRSYDYTQPPWSVRYPEVVHAFDDLPCTPVHNTIADFEFCGLGKGGASWIETPGTSMEQLVLWDNSFADISEDPLLCNSSVAMNLRDECGESIFSDGVTIACTQ